MTITPLRFSRPKRALLHLSCRVLFISVLIGCSSDSQTTENIADETVATSSSATSTDSESAIVEEVVIKGAETAPESMELSVSDLASLPGAYPAGEVLTVDEAPPDSWPLFRGNALATGVSSSTLPEKPELLWKKQFEYGMFETTPAIVDGVVYMGSYDGNFYALKLEDGEEIWRFPTELGFNAPAAVHDGYVYVGDTEGRFFCLDAKTGEAVKAYATDAEINAAANFYEDSVIFGSQDASLYRLKLKTLELVWKFTIDDMIQGAPTVVENRGFVAGCDGRLHIVNLDTGEGVDAVDILAQSGSTPAASGDFVFCGTYGESFFGINWKEAKIVWEYRHRRRSYPFQSSAALAPEMVVVGGRDKMIHGLDPRTGAERWTVMTGGRIDGSPVIVGERAFVGSADGRIYAVEVATGKETWRYEAGGGFIGSPAVAAGRMVIGNDDGDLLCFGAKD